MSYTVLARKYRPQRFSELVGQDHVSRTISNAVESGRIAHAFLFTGVRGVGKTTTARLLAKALNCVKGPAREPCNECDPCREITSGLDLDVLEIDGASNNSVDDVRRLQETLPFRPARDRFKVIIVDEVHMLSLGAFNAFLKTLEEPPEHVKFIFATTESHKVPLTIRSRCQRHDFRLIPRAVIARRVEEILQKESIKADEAAVALVARESAGSMRDALTLLDQVVALCAGDLQGEQLAHQLGIADRTACFEIAAAVLDGEAAGCMRRLGNLADQGVDMLHLARQLLDLLRDLVVLKVVGQDSGDLVDMARDEREAALRLVERHGPQQIERAFTGASKLVDQVARSSSPKIVLEMGLVRLADRPPLEPLTELLTELRALEARLDSGGDAPPPRSPSGRGGAPSAGPVGRTPPGSAPRGRRSRAGAEPDLAPAEEAPPAPPPRGELPSKRPQRPAQSQVRTPSVSPDTAPAVSSPDSSRWIEIVSRLKETQPALGAVLEQGVPVEVDEECLKVVFREGSFFGQQAAEPSAREAIVTAAEKVLGKYPELKIVFSAEVESMGTSIAQEKDEQREKERDRNLKRALEHPLVKEAMEIFPEARNNVDVQLEEVPEPRR